MEDMGTAVVGGGYAGLAAAVSLAENGVPVTLFESSRTLGGRARGLICNGEHLDNGQHILLGCYAETLALIEKTCGAAEPFSRIRLDLSIDAFRLKSLPLPPPLDLLAGMLLSQGLSFQEKASAIRFISRTRHAGQDADIDVAELLRQNRQSEKLVRLLWKPLCISALNTPIKAASSLTFQAVLKDGLDGAGSDIIIPKVDLSTLFPLGAANHVRDRGGEILTSTPVRAIRKKARGFEIITDASSRSFSHVVAAVAPQHLSRLIAELPEINGTEHFAYQPIYTTYSRYPDAISLPRPMMGFSRGLSQWLFDRGTWCGQKGLIAAVASSEGEHLTLSHDAIAKKVHEEIGRIVPGLPLPLWQKVIAEKRATFSCTPNLERPAQKTAVPGFHLAGDYTAGKYPATLEAAVRSGLSCARLIVSS